MSNASIPARFTYSQWRHGGWYVNEVRYPSGAIGCVSRNYPDGKWRIVCGNHDTTFPTREAAARAEFEIAAARCAAAEAAKAPPATPVASDPVPADVPCYLAVAYQGGTETVLGVFRVAEHASAAEAEREAGKLCDRIRAAAPLASYGTRWKNGKGDAPAMVPQVSQQQQANAAVLSRPDHAVRVTVHDSSRGCVWAQTAPTPREAFEAVFQIATGLTSHARKAFNAAECVCSGQERVQATRQHITVSIEQAPPAMVPQPCQPQQGQAAPSGLYAFQARGERAPRKPEPRFMGPQERDGITPKTIQAQTVQVRTRAEWYAFHHACRHLARQRMAAGRAGETMIPANICGRMHRLDVSRLSISHRIEGDRVRRVTNGSHIALKASMISARPRRALIAVELDYAAQYRRNAATEARHGNKHRRGLSIRAARASISEARSLAACCLRLPE